MNQEQSTQQIEAPLRRTAQSSARVRWLKRGIQIALLAVVLIYLGKSLYGGLVQAGQSWSTLRINWLMAILSIVSVTIHMLLVAVAYRASISAVAGPPRWHIMLGVTWLSRIGKYIPGKVFSVAGVAWLLNKYGVSGAIAASMVLVNTALSVIIGCIVAAPLLIFDGRISSVLPVPWLWTAVIVVGGLVCVHPKVCFPLMHVVFRKFAAVDLTVRPRLRDYLPTCGIMVGQWFFAGLTLYFLCRAVTSEIPAPWGLAGPSGEAGQIALMTSVSALAITLGFVALFSPGGIGVRETVYMIVLTPILGLASASMVTVATRLVYTGMEAVLALVGLVILKLCPPRNPPGAPGQ